MKRFLIAALFFTGLNCAASEFSTEEIVLESVYYATAIIDYKQTIQISENPDKWMETNPLLDNHPSRGEVNRHFALTSLLHWGLSELLSGTDYMRAYQVSTIGWNLKCINNNIEIGVKISF